MLALPSVVPLSQAPTCVFARKQFFAHIDLYLEWTFGSGDDLWNTSTFWAHDVTNQRSRLEQMDVLRSMSSGSFFRSYSSSRVTAGGTTYTVDAGNCTEAPASAADISNSACTGSVLRFLPLAQDTSSVWAAKAPDAYLNTTYIDGSVVSSAGTSTAASCDPTAGNPACELVDVFGWNYGEGGLHSSHRVYVSKARGMPLLETQNVYTGYPAATTIRYTIDDDPRGSVQPLFASYTNTFDVPAPCGKVVGK